MLLRYIYHKTFTVKFPEKCEWQSGFNPNNRVGLVWYTDGYKTNKGIGTGVLEKGAQLHSWAPPPPNSRLKYALLRLI
jgi:hypothetical protein